LNYTTNPSPSCRSRHEPVPGDQWPANFEPPILASDAWGQDGLLLITWDQGDSNAGCCGLADGGHVPLLLGAPKGKPGYQSPVPATHYNLLRTIEDLLGWATSAIAATPTSCRLWMSSNEPRPPAMLAACSTRLRAAPRAPIGPRPLKTSFGVQGPTRRILIIEDEGKLAGAPKRGLENEGFAVDLAADGEDGSAWRSWSRAICSCWT
jgi:hypothetical protein